MAGDHESFSSDDPPLPGGATEAGLRSELAEATRAEQDPQRGPSRLDEVDLHGPPDAGLLAFGGEEVVIGEDNRRLVEDPTTSPWRYICALRITTRNPKLVGSGTGWLIGPRTVITAGHCVYMKNYAGWVESIEVIPALNGSDSRFGRDTTSRFSCSSGWYNRQDPAFDYGAIHLNTPLGDSVGWFGYGAIDEASLTGVDANVAGYPSERDRGVHQYFHARPVNRVNERNLFYENDTQKGQSGSPIWISLPGLGERIAIGLHTGTPDGMINRGTRIIAEVKANLDTWRNK